MKITSTTQQKVLYSGGTIYAESNTSLSFIGTSRYGCAIEAYVSVVLTFNGTNDFNSANSGGAIDAQLNTSLSSLELLILVTIMQVVPSTQTPTHI